MHRILSTTAKAKRAKKTTRHTHKTPYKKSRKTSTKRHNKRHVGKRTMKGGDNSSPGLTDALKTYLKKEVLKQNIFGDSGTYDIVMLNTSDNYDNKNVKFGRYPINGDESSYTEDNYYAPIYTELTFPNFLGKNEIPNHTGIALYKHEGKESNKTNTIKIMYRRSNNENTIYDLNDNHTLSLSGLTRDLNENKISYVILVKKNKPYKYQSPNDPGKLNCEPYMNDILTSFKAITDKIDSSDDANKFTTLILTRLINIVEPLALQTNSSNS